MNAAFKSGIRSLTIIAVILIAMVSGLSAQRKASFRTGAVGTRELEVALSGLGYWITSVDDTPDASTRAAVIAFQKVEGRRRTGVMSSGDQEALQFAKRPAARILVGRGHLEIDVARQVLFLVDRDDTVIRVLPVSTGNERRYFDQGRWQLAHTPRGVFKIYRKIRGVRKAPLGNLYYPSYFVGGVAIHGSNSVPHFPASHGCVRIPRFAEKAFFDLAPIGMEVYVYD
jgi:hypothetical protein